MLHYLGIEDKHTTPELVFLPLADFLDAFTIERTKLKSVGLSLKSTKIGESHSNPDRASVPQRHNCLIMPFNIIFSA